MLLAQPGQQQRQVVAGAQVGRPAPVTPSSSCSAPVAITTRDSGSWNSGRSGGRSSRPLTITVSGSGSSPSCSRLRPQLLALDRPSVALDAAPSPRPRAARRPGCAGGGRARGRPRCPGCAWCPPRPPCRRARTPCSAPGRARRPGAREPRSSREASSATSTSPGRGYRRWTSTRGTVAFRPVRALQISRADRPRRVEGGRGRRARQGPGRADRRGGRRRGVPRRAAEPRALPGQARPAVHRPAPRWWAPWPRLPTAWTSQSGDRSWPSPSAASPSAPPPTPR